MDERQASPAELAAADTKRRIERCIDAKHNFLVEAGAGAGKTYSLIEALNHVIVSHGKRLRRARQRVACITYTNVATREIEARTDRHPVIFSSTIHSFCWSLIRPFQPFLREALPRIEHWTDRISEAGGISTQVVDYSLGRPQIDQSNILLMHNDVLQIATLLLAQPKFRALMAARFPVLFIDEYQDTDNAFAEALKTHVLGGPDGVLVGLFGDHWQKIYGTGCGAITHPALERIGKGANFRSAPVIVGCLNRMRPELPQQIRDPAAGGSVRVFHTNDWTGPRRQGAHWEGDLPADAVPRYFEAAQARLRSDGWDFAREKTKILMLTHRVLAAQQGYADLAGVFEYPDSYYGKGDPHIALFLDVLEPAALAFSTGRVGDMFAALGDRARRIHSIEDKRQWSADMTTLVQLRLKGSIGDVLDHLKHSGRPVLPDPIERLDRERVNYERSSGSECPTSVERLQKLRAVPYRQVSALAPFVNDATPFATQHGVKGAEFENVLIVLGRGWNQYNWGRFLETSAATVAASASARDSYERNRNLFYVACSRPTTRLAALFTQQLSTAALGTLSKWFGPAAIHSLGP